MSCWNRRRYRVKMKGLPGQQATSCPSPAVGAQAAGDGRKGAELKSLKGRGQMILRQTQSERKLGYQSFTVEVLLAAESGGG